MSSELVTHHNSNTNRKGMFYTENKRERKSKLCNGCRMNMNESYVL